MAQEGYRLSLFDTQGKLCLTQPLAFSLFNNYTKASKGAEQLSELLTQQQMIAFVETVYAEDRRIAALNRKVIETVIQLYELDAHKIGKEIQNRACAKFGWTVPEY